MPAFDFNPDLSGLLSRLQRHPLDFRQPVERVRAAFLSGLRRLEAPPPPLADVRPVRAMGADGPLPARLYTPIAAGLSGPGLLYFHGGGFMVGDLDSHDVICRRLSAASGARVLSVAYRLAPEHKFPAAPEDAIAATRWAMGEGAVELGFNDSVGVAGDSAGGNLAAVTAQAFQRAKDARLKCQILIYPCTQFLRMTPSQLKFQEGFVLTQAAQDFFVEKYLGPKENAHDWRASPLMSDDLLGLPPALLITAGFDPLLDEGKAYADRMAAAGVRVTNRTYPDQVHGFFNMTALSKVARDAIDEAGIWAKQQFGP